MVHQDCLGKFYRQLEDERWNEEMQAAYESAKRLWAPIAVELCPEDIELALAAGRAETEESISRDRKQAHGYEGDRWVISEQGALGQMAFCRATGKVWKSTLNTFKGPDWGEDIQIRLSPCKARRPPDNFGTLILRPADNPSHRYVLVVGNPPYFVVKGWISGQDGRKQNPRSIGTRPLAWWISYTALNKDLSELFDEGMW